MLVHYFLPRHCWLEVERSGTGRRQWRCRGFRGRQFRRNSPYFLGLFLSLARRESAGRPFISVKPRRG